MTVIDAKDLNDRFALLQENLGELNRLPAGQRNISFSFDMVSLIGPAPIGMEQVSENYDAENMQQIFRIYDDVQVVGVVADLWGFDRPGLYADGVGQQSKAISFNVKILGNFTKLDDELGYPSIYKSTEFNLVKDIKMSFGDGMAYRENPVIPAPLTVLRMTRDYRSNQEYNRSALGGATPSDEIERMPSRLLYYPLDEEEVSTFLHGGAEYIITIGVDGPEGKPAEDLQVPAVPAYHMLTSLQLTLVCRCFRRRFE